ncbi:tail fiber domain-containing protein [bacterium]|nr:tail fiber domain-containing protein [bacterium]
MSITVNTIDANSDTFAQWITITNEMANAMSNAVITANTSEGVTGNSAANLNAKLWGKFAANTILIGNTLASNVTGANVAIEANLELKSAFKFYTLGDVNIKGNLIIDTSTKVKFTDRTSAPASTTTGWLKANTLGFLQFANLAIKGSDFDSSEFVWTSAIGYANSTNSQYDTLVYDTSSTAWVRTRLTHLLAQEIDTLTLGTVVANTSGSVRVNANTNFGGVTSSLYVSNTAARVGVGGITSPQAPLHVQGAIYATGDVSAFYTSDKNLKENITRIEDALEKVRWLKGVEFDWKKDVISNLPHVGPKPDHDIGLIAQEVEQVFPEAVTVRDDGYKAVDYSRLVPVLIEAIKELSYRVNILEAEVSEKYHISSR